MAFKYTHWLLAIMFLCAFLHGIGAQLRYPRRQTRRFATRLSPRFQRSQQLSRSYYPLRSRSIPSRSIPSRSLERSRLRPRLTQNRFLYRPRLSEASIPSVRRTRIPGRGDTRRAASPIQKSTTRNTYPREITSDRLSTRVNRLSPLVYSRLRVGQTDAYTFQRNGRNRINNANDVNNVDGVAPYLDRQRVHSLVPGKSLSGITGTLRQQLRAQSIQPVQRNRLRHVSLIPRRPSHTFRQRALREESYNVLNPQNRQGALSPQIIERQRHGHNSGRNRVILPYPSLSVLQPQRSSQSMPIENGQRNQITFPSGRRNLNRSPINTAIPNSQRVPTTHFGRINIATGGDDGDAGTVVLQTRFSRNGNAAPVTVIRTSQENANVEIQTGTSGQQSQQYLVQSQARSMASIPTSVRGNVNIITNDGPQLVQYHQAKSSHVTGGVHGGQAHSLDGQSGGGKIVVVPSQDTDNVQIEAYVSGTAVTQHVHPIPHAPVEDPRNVPIQTYVSDQGAGQQPVHAIPVRDPLHVPMIQTPDQYTQQHVPSSPANLGPAPSHGQPEVHVQTHVADHHVLDSGPSAAESAIHQDLVNAFTTVIENVLNPQQSAAANAVPQGVQTAPIVEHNINKAPSPIAPPPAIPSNSIQVQGATQNSAVPYQTGFTQFAPAGYMQGGIYGSQFGPFSRYAPMAGYGYVSPWLSPEMMQEMMYGDTTDPPDGLTTTTTPVNVSATNITTDGNSTIILSKVDAVQTAELPVQVPVLEASVNVSVEAKINDKTVTGHANVINAETSINTSNLIVEPVLNTDMPFQVVVKSNDVANVDSHVPEPVLNVDTPVKVVVKTNDAAYADIKTTTEASGQTSNIGEHVMVVDNSNAAKSARLVVEPLPNFEDHTRVVIKPIDDTADTKATVKVVQPTLTAENPVHVVLKHNNIKLDIHTHADKSVDDVVKLKDTKVITRPSTEIIDQQLNTEKPVKVVVKTKDDKSSFSTHYVHPEVTVVEVNPNRKSIGNEGVNVVQLNSVSRNIETITTGSFGATGTAGASPVLVVERKPEQGDVKHLNVISTVGNMPSTNIPEGNNQTSLDNILGFGKPLDTVQDAINKASDVHVEIKVDNVKGEINKNLPDEIKTIDVTNTDTTNANAEINVTHDWSHNTKDISNVDTTPQDKQNPSYVIQTLASLIRKSNVDMDKLSGILSGKQGQNGLLTPVKERFPTAKQLGINLAEPSNSKAPSSGSITTGPSSVAHIHQPELTPNIRPTHDKTATSDIVIDNTLSTDTVGDNTLASNSVVNTKLTTGKAIDSTLTMDIAAFKTPSVQNKPRGDVKILGSIAQPIPTLIPKGLVFTRQPEVYRTIRTMLRNNPDALHKIITTDPTPKHRTTVIDNTSDGIKIQNGFNNKMGELAQLIAVNVDGHTIEANLNETVGSSTSQPSSDAGHAGHVIVQQPSDDVVMNTQHSQIFDVNDGHVKEVGVNLIVDDTATHIADVKIDHVKDAVINLTVGDANVFQISDVKIDNVKNADITSTVNSIVTEVQISDINSTLDANVSRISDIKIDNGDNADINLVVDANINQTRTGNLNDVKKADMNLTVDVNVSQTSDVKIDSVKKAAVNLTVAVEPVRIKSLVDRTNDGSAPALVSILNELTKGPNSSVGAPLHDIPVLSNVVEHKVKLQRIKTTDNGEKNINGKFTSGIKTSDKVNTDAATGEISGQVLHELLKQMNITDSGIDLSKYLSDPSFIKTLRAMLKSMAGNTEVTSTSDFLPEPETTTSSYPDDLSTMTFPQTTTEEIEAEDLITNEP